MTKGTAMVLTGIAGVVGGVLLFVVVANLVKNTAEPSSLPTATFDVGPAKERAKTVAKGGPILFQDLLDRSRDIYVQHLGGGNENWRAFDAHAPEAPRRCFLGWDRNAREFVEPCDGRRFPADGTGLVGYKTTVNDKGRVLVDLRTEIPSGPATTTTTTSVTTTTLATAPSAPSASPTSEPSAGGG